MTEPFKIFSPSYRRAKTCITHHYLPDVCYVVDKAEEDEYRKTGGKLWVLPDGIQGNKCRVLNYILDNVDHKNILIIDDDIRRFTRWNRAKSKKIGSIEALEFIEEGFNLAEQMGVVFWGINIMPDKGAYREYTPFSMRSFIGGPFHAHINNPCRYDPILSLKDDYDMTLQVLNRFRRVLRLNMYNYVCNQAGQVGGLSMYRSINREKKQNDLLQKKWGTKIVRTDSGASKKGEKEQGYDINMIIKVPIGGV